MLKKNFFIASLGLFVEYYDYCLFGFSSALIAKHFFPLDSIEIALLKSFAVFAVSYFAKPFGAIIIGYLGDTYGRKVSLQLCMLGIAVPTTIIGILPSFEVWGWISIYILIGCRIMQGLFISGEYDGVVIYIFEHISEKNYCFSSGILSLIYGSGIYLAIFMVNISQSSFFPEWGWRIPFILGGLLSLSVMFLRKSLTETPTFNKIKIENKLKRDFFVFNRHDLQIIVCVILMCGACSGCYHFYFTFLRHYLSDILNIFDDNNSYSMLSNTILFYILLGPILGMIADKVGPLKTFIVAICILIIAILGNIYYISIYHIPLSLLLFTAFAIKLFAVPVYALFFERAHANIRYRVLSLGHSIGSMLFSGSTAFISMLIWSNTNIATAPFFYFLMFPFLAIFALIILYQPKIKFFTQNFYNSNK